MEKNMKANQDNVLVFKKPTKLDDIFTAANLKRALQFGNPIKSYISGSNYNTLDGTVNMPVGSSIVAYGLGADRDLSNVAFPDGSEGEAFAVWAQMEGTAQYIGAGTVRQPLLNADNQSGATLTGNLKKVNGSRSGFVFPADLSQSSGVLFFVATADDNNYDYTSAQARGGMYLYVSPDGTTKIFKFYKGLITDNPAVETTWSTIPSGGMKAVLEVSGDDLLIKVDSVTIGTIVGALTGVAAAADLIIKIIFTGPSTKDRYLLTATVVNKTA